MGNVKLTWAGHSSFIIEADGYSIVTDPFGKDYVCGLSFSEKTADEVFCSHEHGDHNNRNAVKIRSGRTSPFSVTEINTFHDDKKGKLRGKNIIRIFETDGIRIAHLGDLGCRLTDDETALISGVDCLLIPTGGTYTINAQEAKRLILRTDPRTVIPMHYKTADFGFDVLETLDEFTKLCNDVIYIGTSTIEITKEMKSGTYILVPEDIKK